MCRFRLARTHRGTEGSRLESDEALRVFLGVPHRGFTTSKPSRQSTTTTTTPFCGTQLEKNCEVFRATFPAIDGIDMDCEETYDLPSFVAFSKMLAGMGFNLTFCPYDTNQMNFWTTALVQIEQAYPDVVKWWNLQCYDGGEVTIPRIGVTPSQKRRRAVRPRVTS